MYILLIFVLKYVKELGEYLWRISIFFNFASVKSTQNEYKLLKNVIMRNC